MPRVRKSGAIYPIKYETRKRLKDGSVKTYAGWHAKVDGKWVAAKTYKECDAKIAKVLKEKVTWGLVSGGSTKLADYAEQWYEGHKDLIEKRVSCDDSASAQLSVAQGDGGDTQRRA